jgi:hypothetical protein
MTIMNCGKTMIIILPKIFFNSLSKFKMFLTIKILHLILKFFLKKLKYLNKELITANINN